VRLRLLVLADAAVEFAQAEAAVRDDGAHAALGAEGHSWVKPGCQTRGEMESTTPHYSCRGARSIQHARVPAGSTVSTARVREIPDLPHGR